ncbi:MAG: cupin domain-containing protein [Gammaproteobacteria bacterium]|nr:cupin domain-containing protein [Gammaproteobacteria bacterium]MBQ0840618.1 cupin domain-containing protein [Gammaproteobacteria bacterium]
MPDSPEKQLSAQWFSHCGGLDNFLAEYWQRKPLLIRQALPGFRSPLEADELAGLALEEDIESRLILESKTAPFWSLQCGPFTDEDFQTLPASHWTLLVQAVDQWLPEVHDLLTHFDFLPQWRVDDVMVSYASDQGSVGPHFDQYDVFLLQGEGQRRWRIGQSCDRNTPLLKGPELSIINDFEQSEEWLLEPGDMLYLPPGLAHWGIAEGQCMTYSIGFRAPSATELLSDLATELLSKDGSTDELMYRDPALTTSMAKGLIDERFIDAVKDLLLRQLDDKEQLAQWFARFMTARKYPELELESELDDASEPSASPHRELDKSTELGRHPASRFAALGGEPANLAVDGELYPCSEVFATTVADSRTFRLFDLGALDSRDRALLDTLLHNGSLTIHTE